MAKGDMTVLVGHFGNDAGMFYLGDPCYIRSTALGNPGDEAWDAFLNNMYKTRLEGSDALHWDVWGKTGNLDFRAGCVVTSGYGDGEYPVSVVVNRQNRVKSLTITFISDHEENE